MSKKSKSIKEVKKPVSMISQQIPAKQAYVQPQQQNAISDDGDGNEWGDDQDGWGDDNDGWGLDEDGDSQMAAEQQIL